jgi:phosphatidylserine/phosphatidylglycerophosphate/cardiolipin synthase-like enzyme
MPRPSVPALAAALALAATAVVAVAAPPPTPTPTPTVQEERKDSTATTYVESHFSEPSRLPPQPDGEFRDPRVKDRLTQMIDDLRTLRAPDDKDRISIAFHSLTLYSVADALINAQRAGIKVLVVYDGDDDKRTDQSNYLKAELDKLNAAQSDPDKRGQFVYCQNGGSGSGSCISQHPTGDQHAKYALFSRTKDKEGTTRSLAAWISSANMTISSGTQQSNNGVVVYGAASFYNELRARIFNRALEQTWEGNDYLDLKNDDTRGYAYGETANAHAWASPDNGEEDPVLNQLRKLTTGANPGCSVQVLQSLFLGQRGQDIATELRKLRNPGGEGGPSFCEVQVLVDADTEARDPATGRTVAVTPSIGDEVRRILCPSPNPYPIRVRMHPRVHDKVMLVDAHYSGGTNRSKIVYAGSHNFTDQALTSNDEILLKIGMVSGPTGLTTYNAFQQHFVNLWEHGGAYAGAPLSQPLPARAGFASCPS